MNRLLPRALMAPAVATLFLWMIVPLAMTIYFSVVRYNLMQPGPKDFIGLANYEFFVTDPDFFASVLNTLMLLGSVIAITVVLGVALALLVNPSFPGRGIVRVLLISPFFVMPTANALLWKHMMMNPVYGVFAQVWGFFGHLPLHPGKQTVMPAKAGIQGREHRASLPWIPAFAGMTDKTQARVRGKPSARSAIMLRWTSLVPP